VEGSSVGESYLAQDPLETEKLNADPSSDVIGVFSLLGDIKT